MFEEDEGPARSLIPPRPNLGPEPWDDGGGSWPGVAIGVGAGLVLLALLVARGRARARRGRLGRDQAPLPVADPGPTDPWIAASEAARAALIRAFGPSWRSKTTEEIAADPGLRDRLGPDRFDDLVALFLRADHAKFAADAPSAADDAEASAVARGLAAAEALGVGPDPGKPAGR